MAEAPLWSLFESANGERLTRLNEPTFGKVRITPEGFETIDAPHTQRPRR